MNKQEFLETVERAKAAGLLRIPDPRPKRDGRRMQKLSADQVRMIRSAWNSFERVEDIAAMFGITPAYVSMIGTGRRRSRVQETP